MTDIERKEYSVLVLSVHLAPVVQEQAFQVLELADCKVGCSLSVVGPFSRYYLVVTVKTDRQMGFLHHRYVVYTVTNSHNYLIRLGLF